MDVSTSKAVTNTVTRFKNIFLLGMVLSAGSLVFLVLNADPRLYINYYNEDVYLDRQYDEEYQTDNSSTIRTEGCRIPVMKVDDESIKKMEKSVTKLRPCTPNPLLDSNKSHIWIEKENMRSYNLTSSSQLTCCYKSFYRPKSVDDITSSLVDDRVKYNSCRNFSDIIQVGDEFVRVTCGDTTPLYDSFFVFAREKKLIANPKKDLPYNILILGIDGVSRLNLHRTMPKTVTYLRELGAVEFLGYNKVGDNTFPNLMPLLLGKKDTELQDMCLPNSRSTFDNCPFIWERAQQAGFATALGEDSSWLGTFNYVKRGFKGTPTDYYLHTFIHEAEQKGSNKDGNSKLCLNDKFFYKILLDYVEDLAITLENKLFGFFWEITMSHDNLNYPMVMDGDYSELFRKMHNSGYLNNTIVFLMSDHGMRWGKFRSTRQGFLEDRLPFVMALMPPSFRNYFNEAYDNLKRNSRRLTTPFDMHATLSDLLNLNNIKNEKIVFRSNQFYTNNRGISLFLPVPQNRTCKSADIDDHWCTCYRNKKTKPKSRVAKKAVEYVLSHLNKLLEEYPQCAELSLVEVLEVTQLLSDSLKASKKGTLELTVVFRTNPGGGIFEATLGRDGGPGSPWSLAGSVSRLNLYGNQSFCAPTFQLKLYCYCINSTSTNITEVTNVIIRSDLPNTPKGFRST